MNEMNVNSVIEEKKKYMDYGHKDDIVDELKYIPVPYIGVVGLNATHNAMHAMIWNAFTVNRTSDRPPLYFKLIGDKYNMISIKQKKSSYEWHIPKGILKTGWLSKHLFEIPSVCLLFFDLNWDELQWNEKRTECVAKVEHLRRSLQGRNTRITLVLIQTSTHLPSDDSLVTERAAHLCSCCDLNAKSLFVLPVSDVQQIMGYILRMETALYELSKMYYQYECKLIKGHRDLLNKTTHQLLYVRHQFKIAFFSELKQDSATALKHYKNSYANLMEVRATITNLYEIKTIGGFINYKICKLCFLLNTPLDAISQFRKHIDIFKNKSEPKELSFEHSAWLSKQFSLFGDLFDQAIQSGLVPSQMQNPGYYYYESALEAMQRRQLCHLLCGDIHVNDINKEHLDLFNIVLNASQPMEFFGQRLWRPGCQTLEPLDSEKEKIGIKALQYKEITTVNHAAIIIGLLSSAMTQFQKYKCPRMKRYLMVLVGEEYFHIKDYSNALTFLNNVLPQYRQEGWQLLIQKILTLALHSAYLSADFINFVKLGLEYIFIAKNVRLEDRISVQMSVENIMQKRIPLMLSIANENDVQNALKLWSNLFEVTNEPIVFTIKMDSNMKFIECKPKFSSNTYNSNENVLLELYLQSNCPNPIKFTKLKILFSDQYYNQFCETTNTCSNTSENESQDSLLLMPSKLQMISFNITPLLEEDIGRDITIIGVNLSLGCESMCALMQWSFKDICISWKPESNLESVSTISPEPTDPPLLTTPEIALRTAPLFVELKYPDLCIARNPVILKYIIHNRSDYDMPLELSMGTSDSFMYSGNKLIHVILSAHEILEQHYIMYPLICGSIILPKFRVSINPESVNASPLDFIDQTLPTHLFVLPQNKTTDGS